MGYLNEQEIAKIQEYVNFQFPLWDTISLIAEDLVNDGFQFPLWDTPSVSILFVNF